MPENPPHPLQQKRKEEKTERERCIQFIFSFKFNSSNTTTTSVVKKTKLYWWDHTCCQSQICFDPLKCAYYTNVKLLPILTDWLPDLNDYLWRHILKTGFLIWVIIYQRHISKSSHSHSSLPRPLNMLKTPVFVIIPNKDNGIPLFTSYKQPFLLHAMPLELSLPTQVTGYVGM